MTFTDALLGLLVVAILLVAGDALRRMWADRRSLRIKIDTRFKDLPEEESSELVGKPRRVGGGTPVDSSFSEDHAEQAVEPPRPAKRVREPALHEKVVAKAPAAKPPVARPPVARPPADTRPDAPLETSASTTTPKRPVKRGFLGGRKAPEKAAKPASDVAGDVLALYLLVPAGVSGAELLDALLQQGLRYGDMKIFHLYVKGELLFSMANALQPGNFNIDTMEDDTFRAMTFFVKLPGPEEPLLAFDCMLTCAKYLARKFDGELRDESRVHLSGQMVEHLRERVQEFERRLRVDNAR